MASSVSSASMASTMPWRASSARFEAASGSMLYMSSKSIAVTFEARPGVSMTSTVSVPCAVFMTTSCLVSTRRVSCGISDTVPSTSPV
jgi:hypothetical protein